MGALCAREGALVNQYCVDQERLHLRADSGGEAPLYLYSDPQARYVLYTESLPALLADARVTKPLLICDEGMSFLLQSGVVPQPKTVYRQVYVLGIGDQVVLSTQAGRVVMTFSQQFDFLHRHRAQADECIPDAEAILQRLTQATMARLKPNRNSYLFHSAGKDSNTLALAFAEAGLQDQITLISHQSKGDKDESRMSQAIAQRLGFSHRILHESDQIKPLQQQAIIAHFERAPLPCVDNVSLAYPLYVEQMPELMGSNLIDGMGNDAYIGHVPGRAEYRRQSYAGLLKHLRPLVRYARSESLFHVAGRTQAEWTGMTGFSYRDAVRIYPACLDVAPYWQSIDAQNQLDYFDLRAAIRGKIIDAEIFTRKVRNFADAVSANLILPWANASVAEYVSRLPECYLFDRKQLKNKLLLRDLLKQRISLDSDAIGKMGFNYDSRSIVLQNWSWIQHEINHCRLWHGAAMPTLLMRLRRRMDGRGWGAAVSGRLIYRLFLISMWHNYNIYLR